MELWPTCVVVPAGHRIAPDREGRDYEQAGGRVRLGSFKNEMRGCGPFLRDDPRDRPAALRESEQMLHFGPDAPTALLLPEIPKAVPLAATRGSTS